MTAKSFWPVQSNQNQIGQPVPTGAASGTFHLTGVSATPVATTTTGGRTKAVTAKTTSTATKSGGVVGSVVSAVASHVAGSGAEKIAPMSFRLSGYKVGSAVAGMAFLVGIGTMVFTF